LLLVLVAIKETRRTVIGVKVDLKGDFDSKLIILEKEKNSGDNSKKY